jgi:Lon protease-like protein
MPELLPIFPLNVVAFPGMTVPLHIFEERYRALVRHLLTLPGPGDRLFGIVAIREGYEVGSHEARSMYRTGCVVQLTGVEEYDDGRFDIAAVGRHRMRVMSTDASGAYLRAEVEELVPQVHQPVPR